MLQKHQAGAGTVLERHATACAACMGTGHATQRPLTFDVCAMLLHDATPKAAGMHGPVSRVNKLKLADSGDRPPCSSSASTLRNASQI